MDEVKIYGVCLGRLKYQLGLARKRHAEAGGDLFLLESYNTADVEDIIDILEIDDLKERNWEGLTAKLDDVAMTVSVLAREQIRFALTEEGHLGLYFVVSDRSAAELPEAVNARPCTAMPEAAAAQEVRNDL